MHARNKCRTGIEGLDNALNGGIPVGNTVLVTGACGTGKTTTGMEFLVNGAKAGERGVLLSVTEPTAKLIENLRTYDFFDEGLIKDEKLLMLDLALIYRKLGLGVAEYSYEDIDVLLNAFHDIIKHFGIKRLVIDSITGVCFQLKTKGKIRDFIYKIGLMLQGVACTTLLISEISADTAEYSTYGVEEAIADGIIILGNMNRRGDLLRTLQVVKMRGTIHSRAKYVMDLTPQGVILVPLLKWGSQEG